MLYDPFATAYDDDDDGGRVSRRRTDKSPQSNATSNSNSKYTCKDYLVNIRTTQSYWNSPLSVRMVKFGACIMKNKQWDCTALPVH